MSLPQQSGQTAVEPELQGRTPRAVRDTRGTQKTRFWLWLLFLGVMVPLIMAARNDLGQMRTLLTHGRTATASVIDHHVTYGKHETYTLDYIFEAEGDVISDSADVSHWEYQQTTDGGPLTITYLPGNPKIHRVGTVNRRGFDVSVAGWVVGGTLAFLLLGGLLARMETFYRRARHLLRDGRAVGGVVTERKAKTAQGKYGPLTTYTLCYRFQTPSGERAGQDTVPQSLYNQCPSGTALTVLYDAANPARSRLYQTLTEVRLA